MKKIFLFLILIISVNAQDVEYGDEFLQFGASTRSISLGRAVVALPQHVGGYLVNPAATAYLNGMVFSGMYARMDANQFKLLDYYSFSFQIPTKKGFQFGIHGISSNVDNIFERPDLNNISDIEARRDSIQKLVNAGFNEFNSRESAITFNISKNIGKALRLSKKTVPFIVPVGLNIKIINKDLFNNKGYGIGFDLGAMLKLNLENVKILKLLGELTFGSALSNINDTKIYWDSEVDEVIPMQYITGVGITRSLNFIPVIISLLAQKNSNEDKSQYGSEIVLFNTVSVRVGQELDNTQGGIGILFGNNNRKYGIDYSFANHDLGNSHRFGGWVSF